MKAALKAPSAKMARKWLGRRSATKNASATGPAPRMAASIMSRANPVRRDTSVKPPTVRIRSIMATHLYGHGRACQQKSGLPAFWPRHLRNPRPFVSTPEDVDARDGRGHDDAARVTA